jgi:integrase
MGPEVRRDVELACASVKEVRQVRGAIRAEKMLSPAEVEKLLGALSERGQGFVRFLYATGCRISEALAVRLTDCHVNGGVTIEITRKGGKARNVRLPGRLFKELCRTFHGTTWLFETGNGRPYRREYVTNMIRRASKRTLGRSSR